MAENNYNSRRNMMAIAIIAIVIIAAALTYTYWPTAAPTRRDMVGIITIDGVIESSADSEKYTDLINYAIINDNIKGVVLRIDCPGGSADLVEAIYQDLLHLKEEKTLIASIVFAASGGYYIAVAADYIYVEPSSLVGNIGVIGVAPPILIPSEIGLETGPYKATGFSGNLFPFNLSRVLDNFVSAVEEGRGSRLNLTSDQLSKGLIYIGTESVKVGLADEVGSLQKASKKAGENIPNGIGIIDLNQALYLPTSINNVLSTKIDWRTLSIDVLNALHPPPSVWYLYMNPEGYRQNQTSTDSNIIVSSPLISNIFDGENEVVVDLSHDNTITSWEMNILRVELMKSNTRLRFIFDRDELESSLQSTSTLIVASPTLSYTEDEIEEIKNLVSRGGLLLLFYDPAFEYSGYNMFEPINSLSTSFGIAYGSGYLYNQQEHYGIYRNIYVRNFYPNNLTKNLDAIVLFTSCHIYSTNKAVAWTSNNTYSSVAERAAEYTVIAMVEDEGTIIAFGDLTFLREPNCYVESNYELILNIVSVIVELSK